MTTTNFSAGTVVASSWLNDVDEKTYGEYINVKMAPYNATGDGVTDDTAALQAALDAGYGHIVFIPKGTYLISSALTIQPIYGGTTNLPMQIMGEGYDANGGNGSTIISISGSGNGFEFINSSGSNADAQFSVSNLMIKGDSTNASGGSGIYAKRVANLRVRDCWIQGMRNSGIYFELCYGSSIEFCTIISNRLYGIHVYQAFNLGSIKNVKLYGNGKIYSTGITGNLYIAGNSDACLGVILENVDVSYSGVNAYSLFKRSNNTLTNIVVSGGVATATTSTSHGINTGEYISLVGATTDAALNTTYPVAITSTGATTFTFTTTAANATYTDASILLGPASYGCYIDFVNSLKLHLYSEDCYGPALFLGAGVNSFSVDGSYIQGGIGSGILINDSAVNGQYSSMYLTGQFSKLIVNAPAGPHAIDVQTSVTFNNGASLSQPTLYMTNGTYYSPTVPSTGTWVAGTYVRRSNPTVGGAKGWYCTVGGTPGTWVSEGNL